MKALAFYVILLALVALGCASVAREEARREQERNAWIEYQERGGLTASEYADSTFDDCEAVDEGLDSLQIEAKYFTNGGGK